MDTFNQVVKKCSFCGEKIDASLRRCPYCGSIIKIENVAAPETVQTGAADNTGYSNSSGVNNNGNYTSGTSFNNSTGFTNNDGVYNSTGIANNPEYTADSSVQTAYSVNFQYNNNNNNVGAGYSGAGYSGAGVQAVSQKPLSNGLKVFLTALFLLIPGIGQLGGVITAIAFMNSETDPDRRSFGTALLVASILIFILAFAALFVIALALPVLFP